MTDAGTAGRRTGKLSTWTLGGLMVGPILGSGILLLPPLAYARLGVQAIWAWVLVLLLGGAFAAVFIQMALRTRTDAGIAGLVAREWGPAWGELASNYLTGAVVFGAVPVGLTAGQLWPGELAGGLPQVALAGMLLAATVVLLLAGLTTVSRISLGLSSLTAILLLAGGALGLRATSPWIWPAPAWDPAMGPTLLILFWAIVGWEVVGNYTNDVLDPDRTIPRAGLVSLGAVTAVYLVATLALQTRIGAAGRPTSMTTVLEPLFGAGASVVAGALAGGLCLVTVLMFAGAVTRMTAARAREGEVPRWLGEREPGATPRRAILALAATSLLLLVMVHLRWIDLEWLVAAANLFFLGNALLGLAAAWRILVGRGWKPVILGLAGVLGLLLTQGHPWGWLLFGAVSAGTWLRSTTRARRVA